MSLSVFNPSLCRLAPFHLVVRPALSKPCRSSEFYPNRVDYNTVAKCCVQKFQQF